MCSDEDDLTTMDDPDFLAERRGQQARLQLASEDTGVIGYELLAPERDTSGELVPNRGLLPLPEPVAGDLFFDIEFFDIEGSSACRHYVNVNVVAATVR